MSYVRLAMLTAYLLVIALAVACLSALALHLEHGIGSGTDLLDPDSYSRLFTLHGGIGIAGVLRPGLLAPLGFAHVARSRPAGGRGLGLWFAGFGVLALIFALGLVAVASTGVVSNDASGELALGLLRLLSVADVGVGLGILLGLAEIERTRRTQLDWIIGAVALTCCGSRSSSAVSSPRCWPWPAATCAGRLARSSTSSPC